MAQISGLPLAFEDGNVSSLDENDVMMINLGANLADSGGVENKIKIGSLGKKFNGQSSFIVDSTINSIQIPQGVGQFKPLYCLLKNKYTGEGPDSSSPVCYCLHPFKIDLIIKVSDSLGNAYDYEASLIFKGYKSTSSTNPSISDLSNCFYIDIKSVSYVPVGLNFYASVYYNNLYVGFNWSSTMYDYSGFTFNGIILCNGVNVERYVTEITQDSGHDWSIIQGATIGNEHNPVYWSSKGLSPCTLSHVATSSLPGSNDVDQNTIYYIP